MLVEHHVEVLVEHELLVDPDVEFAPGVSLPRELLPLLPALVLGRPAVNDRRPAEEEHAHHEAEVVGR